MKEQVLELLTESVPVEPDQLRMTGPKPKSMGFPNDSSTLRKPPSPNELPPSEPFGKLPQPAGKAKVRSGANQGLTEEDFLREKKKKEKEEQERKEKVEKQSFHVVEQKVEKRRKERKREQNKRKKPS